MASKNETVGDRPIRRLETHDLQGLLELHRHLHRTDQPLADDDVMDIVWQQFMTSQHFFCFGGFELDTLVTSCTLAVIPNLTRQGRPYGIIENVVTHAEYRNRGWAKATLGHALDTAWQHRCHKVVLTTGRKDDEIIRFYEAAGFDSKDRRAFVARPS
jgi:ribosomal protein S18 acetylase RimI-like enzyme